jgi:hypothetical protein
MTTLNTSISPFVDSQFPAFYREQGPNFIAFIKAYYEWLEQPNGITYTANNIVYKSDDINVINQSRSLLDYIDVDTTEQQFVQHFKNTYINSLPENIAADKQLLVKHILDLYRSKGSQRSYELLFRLLFNEDITIYTPNNFLFKPSDGNWVVPHYIEVSGSQYLNDMIGKEIYNSSGTASAVVENFYAKVEQNKIINVLYISSVAGRFKFGEKIICDAIPELNISNAPTIVGSLTSVSVQSGGYNYSPGDVVSVIGSGSGGKARVVSTQNQNGKVVFNLINGGSGFSSNPVISVLPTLNIFITGASNTFNINDKVTDGSTSANGTVVFANSSLVTTINFSNTNFNPGEILTNGTTTATITGISGGGGSGASFSVGALTNPYIFNFDIDYISNTASSILTDNLEIGYSTANTFQIVFNANTGAFSSTGNTVYSSTNSVTLDVITTSTSNVVVGESLSNTSLGISGLYVYRSEPNLILVTGTDTNLTNANLVSGVVLISNTSASTIKIVNKFNKETVVGNGTITGISGSGPYTLGVGFPSGTTNGYFIPTGTLIDSYSGKTTNIVSVTRTDNWGYFIPAVNQNLDSTINSLFNYTSIPTGTIAYLSNINPGAGYSSNPYISIIEPNIAALNIPDGNGGILGQDAVISAIASSAKGIITSVQVIDSGFGYNPNETVFLQSTNTLNQTVASGTSVIEFDGVGLGSWTDNKGFVSDINYLQDNIFYQQFSYQIIAKRMLNTYESLVRELIHPSGIALFGKFSVNSLMTNNQSNFEEFILQQNGNVLLVDINADGTNDTLTDQSGNNLLDEFYDYLTDDSYALTF